jgi:hypothetical protein
MPLQSLEDGVSSLLEFGKDGNGWKFELTSTVRKMMEVNLLCPGILTYT